jgi:hypothetical protein
MANEASILEGVLRAQDVPEATWAAAIEDMHNKVPLREAARKHGVNFTTLRRRFHKGDVKATRFGPEPILGVDVEKRLHEWLEHSDARGMPVTISEFKKQARNLADKLGIKGFTASDTWYKRFLDRYPGWAAKLPENVEDIRRTSVTPEALKSLYDIVEQLHTVKNIPAKNWFNIDEMGVEIMNARKRVRLVPTGLGGQCNVIAIIRHSQPSTRLTPLHLCRSSPRRGARRTSSSLAHAIT